MIQTGFTTRADGDMRNNKRLIGYLRTKYPKLRSIVRPIQIHKDRIEVFEATQKIDGNFFSIADTDGIITRQKEVVLTVITADCVPIIYSDENSSMIAISHQGWKGLLAHLPEKMINKMSELNCKRENVKAVIGPSINSCCYEVHEDRAIMFRNEFPHTNSIINNGRYFFINLTQLAYEQLVAAGVSALNISHTITCTSCQTDKFYSYRKAENKDDFEEQVSYVINV